MAACNSKTLTIGYEDIARVTSQSVEVVRKHMQRGKFDLLSLESVIEYIYWARYGR